jgi:hypothetical protein
MWRLGILPDSADSLSSPCSTSKMLIVRDRLEVFVQSRLPAHKFRVKLSTSKCLIV